MTWDPNAWWRDSTCVTRLIYHLHETGHLVTARDVIHVIEKPWKYQAEWDEMTSLGETA